MFPTMTDDELIENIAFPILEFEKNTRNRNYLFSSGIDFIYEVFNFENKISNNSISKSIKFLGQNRIVRKLFTKVADEGTVI